MRDYSKLTRRLEQERGATAPFSFAEVESLIGSSLPSSARKHQAWWANTATHSHAAAWMRPGWRTSGLDMTDERVTFRRAPESGRVPDGLSEAPARWNGPEGLANPFAGPAAEKSSRSRDFPSGITPTARRLLEVDCERRRVGLEEAIATMLNAAAADYWSRTWAEADAMSNGVVGDASVDIIRKLRDGEDDDD